MLSRFLFFIAIVLAFGLSTASTAEGKVTVAWIENGNLMVWTQGDQAPAQIASDQVQAAYIAPNGQHIAYRWGTDSVSESLWVVGRDGKNALELVNNDSLKDLMIAAIGWLDASTVYFNTAQRTDVGQLKQDDLWRVDITEGQAKPILSPGEGGDFTFSPDAQWIALVRPGDYDHADGQISLVNLLGQERQELLSFPAVSTGSEYQFYPRVFWETDSNAFRVAIPDRDLIYDDLTALTTLWRLGVDGKQEKLGTIQTSFFGQPQWSFDRQWMVYLQRTGDVTSNQFELKVAAGDGSGATVYETGEAGTLQFAGWLPGVNQFLYAQIFPDAHWLGKPNGEPLPLSGSVFTPLFVSDTLFVYSTGISGGKTFRLSLGDLQTTKFDAVITQTDTLIPVFDAVLAP